MDTQIFNKIEKGEPARELPTAADAPTTEISAVLPEKQNTPDISDNTENAENAKKPKKPKKPKRAKRENAPHGVRELYDWVGALLYSIITVVVLLTFVLRPVKVDGPSMENTLRDGDRLIIAGIDYQPQCGDIVVIMHRVDDKEAIIKRVIATEGQTVDIDEATGEVFVDGKLLDEPYARGLTQKRDAGPEYPLTIGENRVFVMGDNREVSNDSRSPVIGEIDESEILGKASFRIFPLYKFGIVE